MKEIRTEIIIDAAIDKVWNAITDIPGWKNWNSTVQKSEGTASLGAKLEIAIHCDGNDMSYHPIVTSFSASNSFSWEAKMLSKIFFTNERIFELSEKEGKTHLIHKEVFRGLVMALPFYNMDSFVRPLLETMNTDLKNFLEASD